MRVAGEVIDRSEFSGLTAAVDGPEQVRAEVRRQAAAGVDWIKLYTQLDRDELRAGIEEAHAHGLPAVAHLQRVSWTEAVEMVWTRWSTGFRAPSCYCRRIGGRPTCQTS